MPIEIKTHFPHRRNRDDSFDSICPICYRTVSNRKDEAELARDEYKHVCNDWDLDGSQLLDRQFQALIH